MNEKDVVYEAEYGGSVRFLDSQFVTMKDSEGNEMMCKCGKPATFVAQSRCSYIAICNDCSSYGGK